MRLILALQCFFALLFTGRLPTQAAGFLPAPDDAEEKAKAQAQAAADLEVAKQEAADAAKERDDLKAKLEAAEKASAEAEGTRASLEEAKAEAEKGRDAAQAEAAGEKERADGAEERLEAARAAAEEAKGKLVEARDDGALALLAWLQREGRLLDFLQQEIDEFDDEEIGGAVREVHKGCRKVLGEALALEAILPGEEEDRITVEAGFDPVAIALSGNVKGDPPFKGTLMHHGWRTTKVHLPVPETVDTKVLAPAEVEL